MATWRSAIHRLAARTGVDLVRYSSLRHSIGRRVRLMNSLGIELVLDVGANSGQFAMELRRHGYAGRIVSFEPLSAAYASLAQAAAADPKWETLQFALGSIEGSATMNVAANSVSSSLLNVLPLHTRAAPEARFVATEAVEIHRLDGIIEGIRRGSGGTESTYLKIDVQGAEWDVLSGSPETIRTCSLIQLELSLFRLYEGGRLLPEMVTFMDQQGFQLAGVEPGFAHPIDGRLLQLDGLFIRRAGSDPAALMA